MRTARKLLFAALAAACLAPASGALAADLFEPVIEEPDAVPFVETGVNWYLRGDIGYRRYNSPDVFYTGYAPPIDAFFSERLRSIATFGGGFGLRLNSWFRTDVTVDYGSKSKFTGRLTCPGACGGSPSHSGSSRQSRPRRLRDKLRSRRLCQRRTGGNRQTGSADAGNDAAASG